MKQFDILLPVYGWKMATKKEADERKEEQEEVEVEGGTERKRINRWHQLLGQRNEWECEWDERKKKEEEAGKSETVKQEVIK